MLKIIIHPDYNKIRGLNDIAIAKLATSLKFNSNVQPACLPDPSFEPKPMAMALFSSWGPSAGEEIDDFPQISLKISLEFEFGQN